MCIVYSSLKGELLQMKQSSKNNHFLSIELAGYFSK